MRRRMHRRFLGLALVALAVTAPGRAEAALVFDEPARVVTTRVFNTYRSWTVTDRESGQDEVIEQFSTRVHATFQANERMRFVMYYSGGVSQAGLPEQSELQGGADLKVRGLYYLVPGRVMASLGASLPTGRTDLSQSQAEVSRAISPTVLGFPMRRYGEGFDVEMGVTAGETLGRRLAIAGGISLLLKGTYDAEESVEYSPGHELAATVGADWRNEQWAFSGDAVLRTFGDDEINGEVTFEEGTQLELTLGAGFSSGRFGLSTRIRDIVKDDNGLRSEISGSEHRVENGNTLWWSTTPTYRVAPMLEIRGIFDLVAASQTQQQDTSAWALDTGGGVDLLLTPRSMLSLSARYLTGESDDGALDLGGWASSVVIGMQY